MPITPAIAEPSTGETMGQSAEKMAKINHIPREEQDQFALRSHRLAAAGTEDGRLTAEIVPVYVPPRYDDVARRATTAFAPTRRSSSSRALKPVFDKRYGTVTAGNSSPLTDGASAVLLMSEERARALGYHAARVHPVVRVRGARSRRAAAHGAGARGAASRCSAPG